MRRGARRARGAHRARRAQSAWVSSSLSLRGGRLRGLSVDIHAGWLVRSKLAVPFLRRLNGSFLLKRRCAAHCRGLCFCQIVKMCLRWTRFKLDKLPGLACWKVKVFSQRLGIFGARIWSLNQRSW